MWSKVNKVVIQCGETHTDYPINLQANLVPDIQAVLATIPPEVGAMAYGIIWQDGIEKMAWTWTPVLDCQAVYYIRNTPHEVVATCCSSETVSAVPVTICDITYPAGTSLQVIYEANVACNQVAPPATIPKLHTEADLGDGTFINSFLADTVCVSYYPANGILTPVTVDFTEITGGNGQLIVEPNTEKCLTPFNSAIIATAVITGAVGNTVKLQFSAK